MFILWSAFIAFVFAMLALDLGVFHRHSHVVSVKEAAIWSTVWICLGLAFSIFIYFASDGQWFGLGTVPDPVDGVINTGRTAAIKYLTGYVVEKSLSIDNIFVIAMIFGSFGVPPMYQHRVLFWGVVGALVLRGVMIGAGAALVARFHWILLVFGAFLLFAGLKLLFTKEKEQEGEHFLVKFLSKYIPMTQGFHGQHFIVRAGSAASHEPAVPGEAAVEDLAVESAKPNRILFTPLALALIVVEFSDIVFAVDSIPAIFAITGDAFIVFTSNIFAIMGLRSLFFLLAGMIDKFRYIKKALAFVLLLVGFKIIFADWLRTILGEHFNLILLGLILFILSLGVVASLLFPPKATKDSNEAG